MSIKPATILKLTLLGYVLVAIPLTIGLLNTMLQVDRLSAQMQKAVRNSAQAVESGRLITTLVLSMERSALQYLVLKDKNILSRYEKQRESFVQEIQRLLELPADNALSQRLQQLQEHEARLYQRLLTASNESMDAEDKLSEEEQLSNPAASIPFDVTALISRESNRMNEQIRGVRQLLLWQVAALIPLALLIAVTFSLLISTPLHHLGAAIRQLGAGEFDNSIKVNGPQDIRELGEQLDWLRQQLAALNEQKLQFLQHVSHELKTPLTTIREGADLLRDGIAGTLSPEQKEVVQILHSNSLQLQAQVETLLNFNLALVQEQPPERRTINIAELVSSSIDKHRLALRSRNIAVQPRLMPLLVNGDVTQLQTLINNLLSNAIKFSPDGGVIQIRLHQQNQRLLLDIIDQGPGIQEQDKDHLFEPFFQGKTQPSGPVSGTGLGLSLVKRYLHLHGGSIELMDGTEGTHFRVTLPLASQANHMI